MRANVGFDGPGSASSPSAPVPGGQPNPFAAINAVRQQIQAGIAMRQAQQRAMIQQAQSLSGQPGAVTPSADSPPSSNAVDGGCTTC